MPTPTLQCIVRNAGNMPFPCSGKGGARRDPQTRRTTVQKRSYAQFVKGLNSSSKVPAFTKASFNQEAIPGQKYI